MLKKVIVVSMISAACGCISLNLGGKATEKKESEKKVVKEEVFLANQNNIYRNATNIVIDAMVFDGKKWVKSEHKVLIPAMWYIGSGVGMEDL